VHLRPGCCSVGAPLHSDRIGSCFGLDRRLDRVFLSNSLWGLLSLQRPSGSRAPLEAPRLGCSTPDAMSVDLASRGRSEVVPPAATEHAARRPPPTAGQYDSALVGRVVQRRSHDVSESLENVTLSLWRVTWWLKLRELGETEPSKDGTFTLPLNLRQARNWRTAALHVDVTRAVDE